LSQFVVLLKSDLEMFNKPAAQVSLLKKAPRLAAALGVTKFMTVIAIKLVTLL
jgi:hypothetical protein